MNAPSPNRDLPDIRMYLLPGGIKPERQSEGAAGYDVAIRAVISKTEKDSCGIFRKTLFDFESEPDDPNVSGQVQSINGELKYRMEPGESVLVGIGFVTVMPPDMFYWIAPRSGLAAKYGITVTNAPGTVDSDYRGEAGVLVFNNTEKRFDLYKGLRVAQIIFQRALFPPIEMVGEYEDLPQTKRGADGFGSTGLRSR